MYTSLYLYSPLCPISNKSLIRRQCLSPAVCLRLRLTATHRPSRIPFAFLSARSVPAAPRLYLPFVCSGYRLRLTIPQQCVRSSEQVHGESHSVTSILPVIHLVASSWLICNDQAPHLMPVLALVLPLPRARGPLRSAFLPPLSQSTTTLSSPTQDTLVLAYLFV